MDRFSSRLRSYSLVGLDTTLFIYHFERNPVYSPLTLELFSRIEHGAIKGLTSIITLMELLVRPYQLGQQHIAIKYEALLVNFPNLAIIDIDRDVTRLAARLRAEYNLRPPDALQVAATTLNGAQAFITNDRHMNRIRDKIDVIVLDDLIDGG
jgi:predicted nucleic acid-binding protein